MKSVLTTVFASAMLLSSCAVSNRVVPSPDFVTFEVAATNVTAIDASSSITVEYTQSDDVRVSVKCPENIVDHLDVNVNKGRLTAKYKGRISIDGNCPVTINIASPTLSEIDASSSSSVIISKNITVDGILDIEASSSAKVYVASVSRGNVSVDASSSSSVIIEAAKCEALDIEAGSSSEVSISSIEAKSVEAEASSAATISLSGKTDTADYEASSAATIDAHHLVAEKLRSAKASSAANIRCSANDRGSISESSSGSVSFD